MLRLTVRCTVVSLCTAVLRLTVRITVISLCTAVLRLTVRCTVVSLCTAVLRLTVRITVVSLRTAVFSRFLLNVASLLLGKGYNCHTGERQRYPDSISCNERLSHLFKRLSLSGITESLFWDGQRGGARPSSRGAKQMASQRRLHNQTGGPIGGPMVRMEGHGPPQNPPCNYATALAQLRYFA